MEVLLELHSEKYVSDCFQIKRKMILVTDFLSIMNQTEFHLVHNQDESCHYDYISLNLKIIRKLFLWMYINFNLHEKTNSVFECQIEKKYPRN